MTCDNDLLLTNKKLNEGGVKKELSEDLGDKVINFRNDFVRIFRNHYIEKLIGMRGYVKMPSSIDTVKLEIMLRAGYHVAIGRNIFNRDVILGYVSNKINSSNLSTWAIQQPLTEKNIHFVISEKERCEKYKEIISGNDWEADRNFVVLRNKLINMNNDFEIIEHYSEVLSEIEASRFSLAIQSKVMTVFKSDVNDETLNQLISKIYNGQPFLKASNLFDFEENSFNMDNALVAENLKTLKQEFNNHLSELNNMIGLNSTGIDKQSGVSDSESSSNNADVKTNENIYLNQINKALKDYHQQFPFFEARAVFNTLTPEETSNLSENSNEDERERGLEE